VKSPSSIFSSDTLKLHFGVPRGLLLAVGLLIAVETGISRREWLYRVYPASFVGSFLRCENELCRAAIPPQIVIMGNSCSGEGLLPRVLERELHLPEGAVLNLSVNAGSPYEARLFQRRNYEELKKVRLLILGVDDFQFNRGLQSSEVFFHFSTLWERLRAQPTLEIVVGGVWRTFEMQRVYGNLWKAAQTRIARIGDQVFQRIGVLSAIVEDQPKSTPPRTDDIATANPLSSVGTSRPAFTMATEQLECLQQFLQTAWAAQQKVLLVQLPFRDTYMKALLETRPADYENYKRSLNSLANGQTVFFEFGSASGLQETDFSDSWHLTAAGADKFTRVFARFLRDSKSDVLPQLRMRE
jgi:hypothetical protein